MFVIVLDYANTCDLLHFIQ